ncbi:hypothetical protein HPP92_021134 [Vanilla planifolia]|uniref:DUF8041 domain-containing protein n=1 Tax=Vanilla planifolia TaxID=51239 RepID=A0A835UGI9_VANPL|nr:hypothetical protein HPP92_021134 [Vanilla planifolia]
MGESFMTSLTMENHYPSTFLSMDPTSAGATSMAISHEDPERELMIQPRQQMSLSLPAPDINLPFLPTAPLPHRLGAPIQGLSNPQCIHGIEVVRMPNFASVSEVDRVKWVELTGRDLNFSIPLEASDFESWRNLPGTEFEIERPL